jgi:hypothetical protein
MCVGGDKVMSNIRGEPIYRAHPSQDKGRLQIAVGLKSELPFEIVLGEPRGSGVTRQKYPSEGAAIGDHRASAFWRRKADVLADGASELTTERKRVGPTFKTGTPNLAVSSHAAQDFGNAVCTGARDLNRRSAP